MYINITGLQNQKALAAHFSSKQLLHFDFADQYIPTHPDLPVVRQTGWCRQQTSQGSNITPVQTERSTVKYKHSYISINNLIYSKDTLTP